jgi:hypothetical protein
MFAIAKIVNMNWTDNEIQFLINNYPENGIHFCAHNLNKTNILIERKAGRLKIFKNSRSISWTEKDEKFLINNYSKYGVKFCSDSLKRTEGAIITKARRLKIKYRKNLTKDECTLICKKYNNYTEFYKNEFKLYNFIFLRGWLDELTHHMIRIKNKSIFWTKEDCIKESSKYKTIKEWIKNSRSSYRAAHINKWFEECSSNMIKLGSRQLRAIYSFEFSDNHVYVGLTYSPEIRKKYHLNNENSPIYQHIIKSKIIPEFKILTDYLERDIASIKEGDILNGYIGCGWIALNKVKTGGLGGNRLIWNKNNCIIEAKKYKTRKEFSLKNNSAYGSARRNGWLNDCCTHMKPINFIYEKKDCSSVFLTLG